MKRPVINLWALAIMALVILCGCRATATTYEEIHLRADGKGDVATLEEAVEAIEPAGTVYLEAGTYRLSAPLEVDKPLYLVGAGSERTEIVSEGEGFVLRFSGDGLLGISDLTFRHTGEAWADVVLVESGEVEIARSRFTGASGAGLRLGGTTTGTVQDSAASQNGWGIGFVVEGNATPTLRGNDCSENSYGIRINDSAGPTLEGNTCRENRLDGIRFDDNAGGTAQGNECSGNRSGIVVSTSAHPVLKENICTGNDMIGIQFMDDATGLVRRNECTGNLGGIGVADRAWPRLEENICSDNQAAGIGYFGNARGHARRNTCNDNGFHGIGIFDQAQPTVENNTCSGNQVGIYVTETANPNLVDNETAGNDHDGVQDMRP